MNKIIQNIRSNLFMKALMLLIFLAFKIYASSSESEEDKPDNRKSTLRVYLLHPDINIEDALKEKDSSNESINYISHNCQANPGCRWYYKPRSRTTPKFWELVREGTGIDLKQVNDENISEHWLYYVHFNGNKFGVVCGKGEFFKTEKHEFSEDGKKFEYRGICKEYGDPKFGYKVVKDVVRSPHQRSKGGAIEGKPYKSFCSTISGLDFCSISLSPHLNQIPGLCNDLWQYAQGNSYQILKTINENAKERNKEVYDVSDEVCRVSDISKADEDEEGQEVEYTVGEEKKVAAKAYGRYWTYEGLKEYCQHTKEEVAKLIKNTVIELPPFNAQDLRTKAKLPHKSEEPLEAMHIEEDTESYSNPKKPRIDYEGIYNAYAAETQSLMLLDKKCVQNVEVCDILDGEKRILVHVKIGTDSAVLNHLFGQGLASADLLKKQEYRKKIPFELARKKICQASKQLVKERYQAKKDEIENIFIIWKKEYEEIKTNAASSNKENQTNKELLAILEKILLTERKEAIESLKAFGKQIDEKNKKTFEELIQRFSDEHLSLEKFEEIIQKEKESLKKKLNNDLSPDEKFILEHKDFSELNQSTNKLHVVLQRFYKKPEFQNNKNLKKLIDLLDPYRFDLVKDSINTCCNKEQTEKSKSYKEFSDAILLEYHEKRAKRISEEDLKKIVESQDIKAEFDKLDIAFNGFNDGSEAKVFSIVYAIITPKLPQDRDLLPLGARINLLSNVKVLLAGTEEKDKNIKFEVALKIVPDVSMKTASTISKGPSKRKRSLSSKHNSGLEKKKRKTSTQKVSATGKFEKMEDSLRMLKMKKKGDF